MLENSTLEDVTFFIPEIEEESSILELDDSDDEEISVHEPGECSPIHDTPV